MRSLTTGKKRATDGLVNQSLWALVSELLMFALMAASFLVLPIRLSEAEYGIFGAIQGILAPAIQVCTMGAPALFIRRLAQSEAVDDAWHRLISVTVAGAVVSTVLLVALRPWLLGSADALSFLLFAAAAGFLTAHGDYLFLIFMSTGDLKSASIVRAAAVIPRIIGAVGFLFIANASLRSWAIVTFVSGAVGLAIGLLYVRTRYPISIRPNSFRTITSDIKSGYGYALTGISDGVLNASDRPILVNSGFAAQSGSYNLAYRVLGLSLMPSLAMMRASTKRLFVEGDQGIRGPFRVAKRLAVPTAAIGIAVGAALWIGSPLLRIIIGDKFPEVISVIRWLAVLPFVKGLQFVFGNALDASAHQLWRFRLTLSAAGINLVLNLILIPLYSWKAAVGTTILAETFLTITTIAACWLLARRETATSVDADVELPA